MGESEGTKRLAWRMNSCVEKRTVYGGWIDVLVAVYWIFIGCHWILDVIECLLCSLDAHWMFIRFHWMFR